MSNPNIGYATLSIIPSLQGVESLVTGQLPVVAAGGAEAGAAYGREFQAAATPAIGGIGKLLIGLGALKFLSSAISESNQFLQIQGRTANVLKTTGDASHTTEAGLAALAARLGDVDAVSNNVVRSAENVILSYTRVANVGSDKIFDRTTAAALDLAKATGVDVTSAADQLGKALQDPVRGMTRLTRQGIILTTQQREQVKAFEDANNIAAAQGIVLGVVEQKFHGAAAAMATDADKARANLKNLERAVGQDLQPAVTAGANALTGLAHGADAVPKSVQQGVLAFGLYELAAAKLGPRFTALIDRQRDWVTSNNVASKVLVNEAAIEEASAAATAELTAAKNDAAVASGRVASTFAAEVQSNAAVTAAEEANAAALAEVAEAEDVAAAAADRLAAARGTAATPIGAVSSSAFTDISAQRAGELAAAQREAAAASDELAAAQGRAEAAAASLATVEGAQTATATELAAATAESADAFLALEAAEGRAALTGEELAALNGALVAETGGLSAAMSGLLSVALNPLVLGIGAVVAAVKLSDVAFDHLVDSFHHFKGTPSELAAELREFAATGQASGSLAAEYGSNLAGVAEDFAAINAGAGDAGSAIQRRWDDVVHKGLKAAFELHASNDESAAAFKAATKNVQELDSGLAASVLSTHDVTEANSVLRVIMGATHETRAEVLQQLPLLASALREEAAADRASGDAAGRTAKAFTDEIDKGNALRSATTDLVNAKKAYLDNQKAIIGQSDEENAVRLQAISTAKADAQAEQQAARSLVDAKRSEAQAEQQVQDAIRSRAQAVQGVTDAERSRRQALDAVVTAERTEAADEAKMVDLERALTQARKDATEALYRDQDAVARGKLSVESARLALADAEQAAAAGPPLSTSFEAPDPNAQAKLDLAVQQAKLALAEALHQQGLDQGTLNDATKAGIDQSPQVLAAQKAIADGMVTVAADAKAVADAQYNVQAADRAVIDAHYNVEAADRAVEAAHYGVTQAAQSVADSERAVADAAIKSKNDRIVAALQIFAMEQAAKDKAGELATAYQTAYGKAVTAADKFGLSLNQIAIYLGQITSGTPAALQAISDLTAFLYGPRTVGSDSSNSQIPVIDRQGSGGGNLRITPNSDSGFAPSEPTGTHLQPNAPTGNLRRNFNDVVAGPGPNAAPATTLAPTTTFTGPVSITPKGATYDEFVDGIGYEISSKL